MKKYLITVAHDNGQAELTVVATSKEKAIEMVMTAEGCPRCAVIKACKYPLHVFIGYIERN